MMNAGTSFRDKTSDIDKQKWEEGLRGILLRKPVAESARPDDPDPLSMYIYPRLVIVKREDHNHAAFYPPLSRRRAKGEEFSGEIILEFVKDYLKNPKKWIVDSEHF